MTSEPTPAFRAQLAALPDFQLSDAAVELVRERRNRRGAVDPKSQTVQLLTRIYDDLMAWGYDFWLDERDDNIYNKDDRFDDFARATLRITARNAGYGAANRIPLEALDEAIVAIASYHRRNPILQYLNRIHWDGRDHIAALAAHFAVLPSAKPPAGAPADETLFHIAFRRFLVGAVARARGYSDALHGNAMLVLSGPQNIGKSHFVRWLCPEMAWFAAESLRPDDKDCRLRTTRILLWEVCELGATTRRADVEALKQMITATVVTARRPYGRFDVEKRPIASYIGTVNPTQAGLLRDTTGNRRFHVVTLAAIDQRYARVVLADQLWAQAVQILKKDPLAWRLTPGEALLFATEAETNLVEDPTVNWLADILMISEPGGRPLRLADIISALAERTPYRRQQTPSADAQTVAKALGHLYAAEIASGHVARRRVSSGIVWIGLRFNKPYGSL